jgi:hypothetical protein
VPANIAPSHTEHVAPTGTPATQLDWHTLRSEELHALFIRQLKSRSMRCAGHVARTGEDSKVCKVLVGKPEEKKPLGRPRRRWKDEIRMDLGETD